MKLQDIVDELARTLGRSVVVNDLDYTLMAASAQEDDVDDIRRRALLKRRTPAEVREFLESLRIRGIRQPTSVPMVRFDGQERLAVPIRSDDQTIALLWLITGGKPVLHSVDYAAIDAACELIRVVVERDADRGVGDSLSVVDALLSRDDAIARRAFRDAVDRRMFEAGPATTVVAVHVDGFVSELDRRTLARRLSAGRSPRVLCPGTLDGPLLLVVRTRDVEATAALVSRELLAAGMDSAPIGTAALDSAENDLVGAAHRAATAARIVSRVPSADGIGDIAGLGFWALIDSVAADPEAVRVYSPAAYALCVSDDPTQRETVETYLDAGGNVRVACERLHIHRTTLYYRLDNLPQIVKDALDDGPRRSALHMCLKLFQYHRATAGARV